MIGNTLTPTQPFAPIVSGPIWRLGAALVHLVKPGPGRHAVAWAAWTPLLVLVRNGGVDCRVTVGPALRVAPGHS